MPVIILPAPLAERINGVAELEIDGRSAGEVLQRLEANRPQLAGWLLDERGNVRRHVNVFVNGRQAGLETSVGESDSMQVIQAISGG